MFVVIILFLGSRQLQLGCFEWDQIVL